MEKMINAIAAQANELMKSEAVKDMLRNCKNRAGKVRETRVGSDIRAL